MLPLLCPPEQVCAIDGYGGTLRVKFENFEEMIPNVNLCEGIQFSGLARYCTYPPDDCGYETCVRRCEQASACRYAVFKDGRCTIAVSAELVDDETKFPPTKPWEGRAFAKTFKAGGDLRPRYYGGRCVHLTHGECNKDPDCEVNKGKMGYNDEKDGGSANFYCGRVSCSGRNIYAAGLDAIGMEGF